MMKTVVYAKHNSSCIVHKGVNKQPTGSEQENDIIIGTMLQLAKPLLGTVTQFRQTYCDILLNVHGIRLLVTD